MNKYFVFSDVHGCYTFLRTSLEKAGYDEQNPKHILVSLGDNFDRGYENAEILRFLNRTNALWVRGNHDQMLLDYLIGSDNGMFNCTYNGMHTTIRDLANLPQNTNPTNIIQGLHYLGEVVQERFPTLISKLIKLPDGYKIGNYILTHAGFSTNYRRHEHDNSWFPNNWTNTPEFIDKYNGYTNDFKFVCGHWHAGKLSYDFIGIYDHKHEIFNFNNFIGIDTCTNITEKVNILVIETEENAIPFSSKHALEEIKKM